MPINIPLTPQRSPFHPGVATCELGGENRAQIGLFNSAKKWIHFRREGSVQTELKRKALYGYYRWYWYGSINFIRWHRVFGRIPKSWSKPQ